MLVRGEIRGPEQVDAFVCEPGRCPYSSKTLDPPGFHTDLFQQLPLRTYPRIFSRIQPPRGDLDQRPVRGVSVLLNEQDRGVVTVGIRSKRNHRGGSRVPDDFELSRGAVGKAYRIRVQFYDPPSMNAFSVDLHLAPCFCLTLVQPGERLL